MDTAGEIKNDAVVFRIILNVKLHRKIDTRDNNKSQYQLNPI